MRELVQQRSRNLRIAKDAAPFAEREVRGDYQRDTFVEIADQMEQQCAAIGGERQVAQLIENDQILVAQTLSDAATQALRIHWR